MGEYQVETTTSLITKTVCITAQFMVVYGNHRRRTQGCEADNLTEWLYTLAVLLLLVACMLA